MLKIRMSFTKDGAAAYLSHLDVMRTFSRSFIRAGIRLRHTEGFNPHPYLSIAHPLPVGFTSECELLDCEILSDTTDGLTEKLNASLPAGFHINAVTSPDAPIIDIGFAEYALTFLYDGSMPENAAEQLGAFFAQPEIKVVKKGKKGPTEINLAEHLSQVDFIMISENEITAHILIKVKDAPLNPRYFVAAIEDDALRPDFIRYRRTAFFDAGKKRFC